MRKDTDANSDDEEAGENFVAEDDTASRVVPLL